jgi:molybdenum cofactor cytidylyltransferase
MPSIPATSRSRFAQQTVVACRVAPFTQGNGFDFVLQRLSAGIPVTGTDIMRMGVGGLLQEIPTRPQPRDTELPHQLRAPRIAAVVLAAGCATRMGSNKLLAEWRGKPLLRLAVEAALKSGTRPVIVVTSENAKQIRPAWARCGLFTTSMPKA